uniref:ZT_dimer domain-containing protein n=1 Tax=Panagrellus redivivus TaxID=6233 RepID=A0A7E4V6P9_PANRE
MNTTKKGVARIDQIRYIRFQRSAFYLSLHRRFVTRSTHHLPKMMHKELNLARIQLEATLNDLKMQQQPHIVINDDEELFYYCDKTVSRARAETKAASSNRALKTLIFVSILTIFFIVIELTGGIIAHSLAIMTDAFHMISDLASFLISIMAITLARRSPNSRYSFGYQRAEVIGALASIILVWILTASLVYFAIERIISGKYDVEPNVMMITSGVGVLFNIIMGIVLHFGKAGHSHFGVPHNHDHGHGHGHGHSHGHDHGHKHSHDHGHVNHGADVESQTSGDSHSHHSHEGHEENINIRAAFIHVIGDLVQSVGVFISAVIIKFTGFEMADPLCTFLFSILVLFTTYGVMRDTLRVLMECAPSHIDAGKMREDLMAIDGVSGVHSLRIWSLKMDSVAVSVHIDTVKQSDVSSIVYYAHQILQTQYNIDFVTVQAQCTSPPSIRSGSVSSVVPPPKELTI